LWVQGDRRRSCRALRDLILSAVDVIPDRVPVVLEADKVTGEDREWVEVAVRAESLGVPLEIGSNSPSIHSLRLYVVRAIAGGPRRHAHHRGAPGQEPELPPAAAGGGNKHRDRPEAGLGLRLGRTLDRGIKLTDTGSGMDQVGGGRRGPLRAR